MILVYLPDFIGPHLTFAFVGEFKSNGMVPEAFPRAVPALVSKRGEVGFIARRLRCPWNEKPRVQAIFVMVQPKSQVLHS